MPKAIHQPEMLSRSKRSPNASPWLVAADVCRALGLTNTTEAMRPLWAPRGPLSPLTRPFLPPPQKPAAYFPALGARSRPPFRSPLPAHRPHSKPAQRRSWGRHGRGRHWYPLWWKPASVPPSPGARMTPGTVGQPVLHSRGSRAPVGQEHTRPTVAMRAVSPRQHYRPRPSSSSSTVGPTLSRSRPQENTHALRPLCSHPGL